MLTGVMERVLHLPAPIRPYFYDVIGIIERKIGFDNVRSIILFGSYARGEYTSGSDVDILIIFKNAYWKSGGKKLQRRLEGIFSGLERKNRLRKAKNKVVDGVLTAIEKNTGMFVSHFLCCEDDWCRGVFHKIFNVSGFMSRILAPSNIVLRNIQHSYIPIYGDLPKPYKPFAINTRQLLKSMFMNLILAVAGAFLYPIKRSSVKYSMESFKWSIRNSYLYLFDRPASLKDIISFYSRTSLPYGTFAEFLELRLRGIGKLGFAVKNIGYVIKIHIDSLKFGRYKKTGKTDKKIKDL